MSAGLAELLLLAPVGASTFAAVALGGAPNARAELTRALGRLAASARRALSQVPAPGRDSGRARAARARRDMPTFLDVVTLGLSAGLSFDASLELYCKRYDTPLAEEMANAQLAWRMGYQGRGEALEAVAKRLDLAAMDRFAMTVSEALAFGTPLADALERQAQGIRDEQRSDLEAEIERVPVKMLIPLGTLIVPAMLLAILGPLLGPALGST